MVSMTALIVRNLLDLNNFRKSLLLDLYLRKVYFGHYMVDYTFSILYSQVRVDAKLSIPLDQQLR
jgi:hypothetical protein